MIKAKIFVNLKSEVHDPQSTKTKETLNKIGFKSVKDLKCNKYFEVTFDETDVEKVKDLIEKISRDVLVNSNIESYTYNIDSTDGVSPSTVAAISDRHQP